MSNTVNAQKLTYAAVAAMAVNLGCELSKASKGYTLNHVDSSVSRLPNLDSVMGALDTIRDAMNHRTATVAKQSPSVPCKPESVAPAPVVATVPKQAPSKPAGYQKPVTPFNQTADKPNQAGYRLPFRISESSLQKLSASIESGDDTLKPLAFAVIRGQSTGNCRRYN